MSEDRRHFVEGPLQELCKSINPKIREVSYDTKNSGMRELLYIIKRGGTIAVVDITHCSLKEIVMEVMRRI